MEKNLRGLRSLACKLRISGEAGIYDFNGNMYFSDVEVFIDRLKSMRTRQEELRPLIRHCLHNAAVHWHNDMDLLNEIDSVWVYWVLWLLLNYQQPIPFLRNPKLEYNSWIEKLIVSYMPREIHKNIQSFSSDFKNTLNSVD